MDMIDKIMSQSLLKSGLFLYSVASAILEAYKLGSQSLLKSGLFLLHGFLSDIQAVESRNPFLNQVYCVFRSNRPPIPEHSGHLFQSKSAT